MNVMRTIGRAFGDIAAGYRSAAPVRQSYDPQWFDKGLDVPPMLSDAHKVRQPYVQSGTAHRAVRVISDMVAAIRFGLIPEGSDDWLPDSDVLMQTFLSPNARMSGRRLWKRAAMDLMLSGNAVWMIDGEARLSSATEETFPRFLVPLPMDRVAPDYDQQGRHVGFALTGRGGRKRIPLEQTVHHLLENPDNMFWGMSEVAAIQADMDSYLMAALTNIRLLKRGGPGVVVEQTSEASGLMGPEARERVQKDLDEGYQDEDEHSAMLLDPGMKLVKAGATQRDMDFDKLLRLSRENITGGLGSVPALAGILEYANYANMASQLEYVYQFTVFPMCDTLEAGVQAQLLDRFGVKARARFDRTSCRALYQNLESLARTAKSFYDMRVPFSAINDKLELGFDLDEYPWLKEDPGPAGLGAIAPPGQAAGQAERMAQDAQRELTRSAKWLKLVSIAEGAERRYLGAWRQQVDWLRDEVLRRVKAKQEAGGRVTQKDAGSFLPSEHEISANALRASEPAARQAATAGRRSVATEVGPKGDISPWELLDPKVTKLVQARRVEIVGASKEMAQRMRDTLADGIDKGETITDLADRIRLKHREEYLGQAKVIARTETLASFSNARELTKKEAGIESHEWLSARDSKVRESHLIDGEVVKIGTKFSNGLLHPHDPDGEPEEVIQCRCIAASVVS